MLDAIAFTRHRADGSHKGDVMIPFELEFDDPIKHVDPIVPRVLFGNDEVSGYTLMHESEVVKSIFAGQWKPQCAIVTLDFLIRHGRITPETDARFAEVCAALRSDLGCLPMPCYA